MQQLATEKSFQDIVSEFCEYVVDVDQEISKRAIRAIGSITIRVEQSVDMTVESLLGFLNLNTVLFFIFFFFFFWFWFCICVRVVCIFMFF